MWQLTRQEEEEAHEVVEIRSYFSIADALRRKSK